MAVRALRLSGRLPAFDKERRRFVYGFQARRTAVRAGDFARGLVGHRRHDIVLLVALIAAQVIKRHNKAHSFRTGKYCLLRVFYRFGLAQEVDLDLPRVFKLILYLFGNIPCKQNHLVLVHLIGLYHDANLAPCLNGV